MKIASLNPELAQRIAQRTGDQSGLINRVRLLLERRVDELSAGDIAFCLRQSIVPDHVAPIAIEILSKQPLVEAELYDGDLLMSLFDAARNGVLNSEQLRELRGICSEALAGVEVIVETVAPAAKAFIDQYDHPVAK